METALPFVKCLSPVQVKTSKGVTLVPCGHCAACESRQKSDLQLRIQIEAQKHKHSYFITLTYDDAHLPIFSPVLAEESYYDNDFDAGFLKVRQGRSSNFDLISDPAILPTKGAWICNQSRVSLDGFSNFNNCHNFNGCCGHYFEHPYGDIVYQKGSILGMLYDYHCYLGKCKQAAFTAGYAAFVTSWYKQVSTPFTSVPLLYYKDAQNFLKRLRKQLTKIDKNEKIRYYIIGEYGSRSLRPHWHLLLFTNSDKIAEHFANTSFEVDSLRRSDRRFYSNSVLRSCWQFGFSTVDKADSKVAGYVSNYVVGSSLLPRLLQELAPQKTFHSVNFGIPVSKEKAIDLLRGRNFKQFSSFEYVDQSHGNVVKSRSLWRSYYNQFFPKFTGSHSLSDNELLQVFGVLPKLKGYFFEESVEKIAKKVSIYLYWRKYDYARFKRNCNSTDVAICDFFDWFDIQPSSPFRFSALKTILYASKKALSISQWLGIGLSEYTRIYIDFYKWLDSVCLAQHYANCLNNNYLQTYYNIYGAPLQFGEKLFDRYKYSVYFNYFKRDTQMLSYTRLKHKEVYEQIKNI